MSQVIPNHVLRVGQTVCMAPKEESGGFRQVVHSKGISITSKCPYYTPESYVGQMTSQVNGHRLANTIPYGGQESMKVHQPLPGNSGNKSVNVKKLPAAEVHNGADPLSPSLDISIDNLNQLILQLDPTFQPLAVNSDLIMRKPDVSPCRPVTSKVTSTPEVKCVGVNPPKVVCHHESIQRASSPNPRGDGILIARGTQSENISPNGSLIFSEPQSHAFQDHYQCPPNGGFHQSTEIIAIPSQRSNQQNQIIMSASYGSDSTYQTRPSFYSSEASMMSTSPGSDTSYVLGSTQSLQYDDTDGHFHSRLSESPFGSQGSFSNLYSPVIMSPAAHINHFDHNGSFSYFKPSPHTSTKSHANSCPPSVSNSTMDIPILLVNGIQCPENEDISHKCSRQLPDGNKQRRSSNFNKTSSESSIPTCTDSTIKDGQPGMKFVMDTSKQWFKPNMTRDQAIELLKDKEPGAFIIRDSTSYRGCFGLAVKIPGTLTGKVTNELVRHFLIESSVKGVHLKGASEEPYFGSLPALVYQHTITPLSLPCKLLIPLRAQNDFGSSSNSSLEGACELKTSSACNVLYLNSVSTETLTGSSAIQKAVTTTFERANHIVPTIVHFKATDQGVILTDVQRKVFFRRHYPVLSLSFCSVDPEHRKWQKHCRPSRIFGFVAKNPTNHLDNVCHVFAEYDAIQPASPLISCLTNLIQQQNRV